jgi:hypothetical protein
MGIIESTNLNYIRLCVIASRMKSVSVDGAINYRVATLIYMLARWFILFSDKPAPNRYTCIVEIHFLHRDGPSIDCRRQHSAI